MGLFGMSQEGKDARNSMNWAAGQLSGNGNEMDDRSIEANSLAGFYRQILEQLYKPLYDNGWSPDASPGNWTNLGKEALPSVQTAMDNGTARYNNIVDPAFRGITSANDVAGARRGFLDDAGARIDQERSAVSDIIRNGSAAKTSRNDGASGAVMNYIEAARQGLTADSNDTLGGIKGRNGGEYDSLGGEASSTYGGMRDKVGSLLDFDNAASARSFAPARAAAARRLRASGINPDSVEADSVMGRVDNARARAFDDNRAGNIDKQNLLSREEFGINSDLRQKKMADAEGLDRDALATRLSLGKDASERTQAETLRSALYDNEVADQESALALDANKRYYDQQRQWDEAQADEAVGNRDRQIQDWQNAATHAQAGNATDQNNVALETQRYNTGQGVYDKQFGQYMTGVNGLQGMFTGQQNYALGNNGQAQSGWTGSIQPYQQIYQNEAANSNWLGKGLLSLAGTAIGGFTGGLGGAAGKSWFGGGK